MGTRDLATVASSNVIANAITAAFWIFIASVLSTEEYGELGYFIAIASIISAVAFAGSGTTLIVYIAKGIRIQSPIFFTSTAAGLAAALVAFLLLEKPNISLYIVGYVLYSLAVHEMLGRKLYRSYSLSLILQRSLIVVFAVVLYHFWGTDGIILGFALSFFPYAYRAVQVFREGRIDLSALKPYKGFMANISVIDISKILTMYLDRIVILPLFGFATLGNYHLAMQFVVMASILPSSIYQFVLPQEASGQRFDRLKKLTIVFSAALSVTGVVLVPVLMPVLFPQYVQSTVMIQIMSVAIVPLTVNFMIISRLLADEKGRTVVTASVIFIIIQITGIVTLGDYYDARGIAMAIVIAASGESAYLLAMSRIARNPARQSTGGD